MAPSFLSFSSFRKSPSHPYISSPNPEYAPLISEKETSLLPVPTPPPHSSRDAPPRHSATRLPSASYTHNNSHPASYLLTKPLPLTPPPPPKSAYRQKPQQDTEERDRRPEYKKQSFSPARHVSFDPSVAGLPHRPALISKYAVTPSPCPKDITLSFEPQVDSPIDGQGLLLPPSPNPPASSFQKPPRRVSSLSYFPPAPAFQSPILNRQQSSQDVPLVISPSVRQDFQQSPLDSHHQNINSPPADSTLDDIYANYASHVSNVSGGQQSQSQPQPQPSPPSSSYESQQPAPITQDEESLTSVERFIRAQQQLAATQQQEQQEQQQRQQPSPFPEDSPSVCPSLTPTSSKYSSYNGSFTSEMDNVGFSPPLSRDGASYNGVYLGAVPGPLKVPKKPVVPMGYSVEIKGGI